MTHALAPTLLLLCSLAVGGLLLAEHRGWATARALCKTVASTTFVALALAQGALASSTGQVMLAALVLSWVGDVCLLSSRSVWFLAGLGAFLLAHVAFAVAFALGGIQLHVLGVAAVAMAAVGGFTLRWLWPHLEAAFKGAVGAYVLAIVAMCALAVAHAAHAKAWVVAAAALAFAASDISVARDRFVAPGFVNKAWGLPVYFAAQLLFAWTLV